jgi:hypothetical protein
MAETTADVRRDIELTRERMSSTLAQLEQKMNVVQIVKDHPWPAIAVAFGAGVLLSGSKADVKATAATLTATRGASSKIGTVLDDLVANLVTGVRGAFEDRVEGWVHELKSAIGANTGDANASRGGQPHAPMGDQFSGSTQRAESGMNAVGAQASTQNPNSVNWQPTRAD